MIHLYDIVYDGHVVGTIISTADDPMVAVDAWIERIPNALNHGLRKSIRENRSLVTAIPHNAVK